MNQELFNQFLAILEASSSFKMLNPDDQAAIKASYRNASDEQLNAAIQAINEDQVRTKIIHASHEEREAMIEEENLQLKTTLHKVVRNEQKEAEEADSASDKQEIQDLMQEIKSIDSPKKKEETKKRKKFLGIF